MTTEMQYDFIDDVSRRNNVLVLAVVKALPLSAGVWTKAVADSISRAQFECLNCAVRNLVANRPNWEFWLIVGHKTFQPNNRITRHNGLWKSLKNLGLVVPQGQFIAESALESEDGLRVFGAVRFDASQIQAVHAVMRETQAAVAFIPGEQSDSMVTSIVRHGWLMKNTKPPEEILENVCVHLSGLVLDVYGDFDDPEASVAVIGKKDVILDLDLRA